MQWPTEKEQNNKQYKFVLLSFFLLTIVLFVILFFFCWPLYCLLFCSFSVDHCIVCPFVFLSVGPTEKEQNNKQYNGH
jgi:hypothetical protein